MVSTMLADNKKLRKYLLDDLPDSEMGEVDLWIIADEMSGESVSAAEHDLIEDYLERTLSVEEEALFRSKFLVSAERRCQYDEVLRLKRFAAAEKPAAGELPVSAPRSSYLSRLFPFSRPLTAAFAVIAIALLGFIGWRVFLSPTSTPLEVEYAVLNETDLAAADSLYSTVQLSSGTLRDTGSGVKVTAAGLSESVLIRLALPFNPPVGFGPKIEIIRNTDTKFTLESDRIYPTGAGSEIRVLIPRSILVRGQHQIRLTDGGKADSALLYSFTVE